MSDLIKREDAINSIYKLKKTVIKQDVLAYCDGLFDALEIVQDLPSADRWIPCSERLPEEKEVVAVIIKRWDTGEIKKGITYRVDCNMWVGFGRHNKACVWWLPLPPWKGADDE